MFNGVFFKESCQSAVMLSKLWRKTEKGQSLGKLFSGLSEPNSLKFEYLSDAYLNSMCIKFRSDWSTGSCKKDRFSKSRSKVLLSPLWRKSEKGQSFGKRFSELSGPNSLKLSQFFHQCLNSISTKFRADWTTGSSKKMYLCLIF